MRARPLRAFFAALLLLGGCGREKVVRIAVAVPMTGDMGTEGQGLRRAVELAIEEANAAKRFPYRVEVLPYDDRADPQEAVNVANLIIADPRVVAVVGHYNSGCAIAAAPVYASAAMAMVTPSATNPDVTRQQLAPGWAGPRVVFRLVPTDDVEAAASARFVLRRLGKRTMSVLHDQTPYGQGLAEEFARTFRKLGGRVAGVHAISVGEKDFRPLLSRIASDKTEGVYYGGLYTEAGLIVKQMRELGMKGVFVSGDGSKTSGLFDVAGEAADGAYLSIVGVPVELLPSARAFMADYRRRWPEEGQELKPFDHFGYEAARIVLDALAAAGPDRPKVLEAIRGTRYTGLLGTTVFDEKGDTLNRVITMTRARAKDRAFPAVE